MKKVYLIQYKTVSNSVLDARIKALGIWLKYFGNNWIVESDLNPKDLYEQLTVGYDNESIFIIELNASNYYGRMDTKVWDFLKDRKKA